VSVEYADTSFVLSLYRPEVSSIKAIAHLAARANGARPLEVSTLLAFEFEQGLQHRLYRKTINQIQANKAFIQWETDLASGTVIIIPTDWPQVFQEARRIAKLGTMMEGYRSMDILHVAAALVMEATVFLTFDERQTGLAKAEGLKVKPA
jgi:hypothetical protein